VKDVSSRITREDSLLTLSCNSQYIHKRWRTIKFSDQHRSHPGKELLLICDRKPSMDRTNDVRSYIGSVRQGISCWKSISYRVKNSRREREATGGLLLSSCSQRLFHKTNNSGQDKQKHTRNGTLNEILRECGVVRVSRNLLLTLSSIRLPGRTFNSARVFSYPSRMTPFKVSFWS
jgi:hypothetical protein